MKKVLVYIKGFNDSERVKLARMTALWISNGSVPPAVLNSLINVSLVMVETIGFSLLKTILFV